MYLLQMSTSTPALYVELNNGFFGWTTNTSTAFQMVRNLDAMELQKVIEESTTIVNF